MILLLRWVNYGGIAPVMRHRRADIVSDLSDAGYCRAPMPRFGIHYYPELLQ